jgi:hypothetical protein
MLHFLWIFGGVDGGMLPALVQQVAGACYILVCHFILKFCPKSNFRQKKTIPLAQVLFYFKRIQLIG